MTYGHLQIDDGRVAAIRCIALEACMGSDEVSGS